MHGVCAQILGISSMRRMKDLLNLVPHQGAAELRQEPDRPDHGPAGEGPGPRRPVDCRRALIPLEKERSDCTAGERCF